MQAFSKTTVLAAFLATVLVGSVRAEEICKGSARGSSEYREAAEAVLQLPEFKAWAKTNRFPVMFGEHVDKKVSFEGQCYWSVSVYADQGSHFEMWHVILVGNKGRDFYIDDGDGETISLKQWRKKRAGRG